jgi:hypothetical protein
VITIYITEVCDNRLHLLQVLNGGDATCYDQPDIVNVIGVAVSKKNISHFLYFNENNNKKTIVKSSIIFWISNMLDIMFLNQTFYLILMIYFKFVN